jgi:transcriptional regulator with XRE-family HTH domain
MEKTKLKKIRFEKGFTQQQIADYLATDKSNYCKKENGIIKITDMEWEKLAKKLNCDVDEIKEEDHKNFLINSNQHIGNNNVINPINEVTLKYIAKLEEEIASLKEEIKRLKERN